MIDAGLPAQARELEAAIKAVGVDPASIAAVIITHGHADHAGGASYFKETYGAQIVAGRGDHDMLESGVNNPICPTDFIARAREEQDLGARYAPTAVDHWVEAEAIELGPLAGIEGTILPLPGHTPGSLVVIVGEAAFVGDLIRGSLVSSAVRTHFYMCDLDDNRADVRALLERHAPGASRFFMGHFGPASREAVGAWLGD